MHHKYNNSMSQLAFCDLLSFSISLSVCVCVDGYQNYDLFDILLLSFAWNAATWLDLFPHAVTLTISQADSTSDWAPPAAPAAPASPARAMAIKVTIIKLLCQWAEFCTPNWLHASSWHIKNVSLILKPYDASECECVGDVRAVGGNYNGRSQWSWVWRFYSASANISHKMPNTFVRS